MYPPSNRLDDSIEMDFSCNTLPFCSVREDVLLTISSREIPYSIEIKHPIDAV